MFVNRCSSSVSTSTVFARFVPEMTRRAVHTALRSSSVVAQVKPLAASLGCE